MLPGKAWFHSHVMNLGADVCIPFGLSVSHCMCDMMVQAFEFFPHDVLGHNGEFTVDCMKDFIVFLDWGSKRYPAHLELSFTLAFVMCDSEYSCL